MSLRRETDFPATSIGRSSGARLQQASAAHEAHPLLSPGPSSPTPSEQTAAGTISGAGATLIVNGGPKYVPYTPRQRVTPTAATTGTTVHPSSPPQHQGDATSKLQLMHLKAAAQAIGLDSGTLGWSILERLVVDVEISEEWTEVWSAITSGKATLLLPLEAAFTNEKITADFVKDHVILCDGPSRKSSPIITLSGLRGTLNNETLTFRSTINPTTKLFQDLLNPTTRTSALSLLPPLPVPLPDLSTTPPTYPSFNVPSYSSSLHLPPRSQAPTKPPLPPRPNARPVASSSTAVPSRISNPFASLFGGGPSKTATPIPPSPPASLRSLDSAVDSSAIVEVSAFTINRRIVRKELAKEVNKAVKGELRAALAAAAGSNPVSLPLPPWVADRVHDLAAEWYPFVKNSSPGVSLRRGFEKGGKDAGNGLGHGQGWIVNPVEENPDDVAERLQDFYLSLEQDMRAGGTPFLPRRKEREREREKERDGEAEVEGEKDRERREHDRMESETRIREVMEAVERTITSLFYDRLFMQPTTDDASHDEALSSRVAALNMLDLGLGHLGIEVGEAVNEAELDAVVKACGEMLTQLDTCRSPGDKSAILVAAHKVVVDGLSRLPPIRLISEHDVDQQDGVEEDLQTAKPNITPKNVDANASSHSAEHNTTPAPSETINEPSNSSLLLSPSPTPVEPSPATEKPIPPPSKVKSPPPPLPLDEPPIPLPTSKPPQLELATPPKEPTPVSGDVLLPLIIFSVVKANPPHLVSNLLFTQRFRNQSVGGEESYCLINLMAVAEFLENVDMAGLGLGDSDKVMSTADLTPIPLTRSPVTAETPLEPLDGTQGGLRGRVGQQVDAIADSANKVISGVVDSSFGILRSFMPTGADAKSPLPLSLPLPLSSSPNANGRPGFGLLRRESGFSIASLAASLPMPIPGRSRSNTGTGGEEAGQQLVAVSRPGSVRSRVSVRSRASLRVGVGVGVDGEEEEEESQDEGSGSGSEVGEDESVDSEEESEAEGGRQEVGEDDDDDDEGEDGEEGGGSAGGGFGDARSIRSFESMLSASKGKEKGKEREKEKEKGGSKMSKARKSLSDRLASVSALAGRKGSPPGSRRSSFLQPQPSTARPATTGSPSSSRAASPVPLPLPAPASMPPTNPPLRLAPPKQRFVDCEPDDLRLAEVGELLREYRRLVEGVRSVGGFEE
ncbi:hypothetical protein GALMADRAFT_258040 [Galerina marginata CBS 339.88]|uniref:VPS9 domain-containing protein n=1 Tax=Galerina marginata (strain CBS 339.88) TaxID=685588 RepID=A0A067SLT5_GALM3|nr:hypothetical protein GALMADRAFT_258040 [Galerina marginata CBS 339.88]